MSGFDLSFLYEILNGQLTEDSVNELCNTHFTIYKNDKGRSHPRVSKKVGSKWYTRSHSNESQVKRMLFAIKNNKLNELHPNDKSKSKKYTIVKHDIFDEKKYKSALLKPLISKNSRKSKKITKLETT